MNKTLKSGNWSNAFESSSLVVGLMLLVAAADYLLPLDLRVFGIVPRRVPGLIGVAFSPLLHADTAHLMANSLPLFVLLLLLFWDRRYHPVATLAVIWVASGFGTWLIGRGDAIHIGASSIIYGLVVYLMAAAFWMKRWRPAIVAIFVFVIYGGIFYGVLPQRGHVSWEGHLAGAIAGWWTARRNHA
ncbi:MAG: rhomboid family intramembrane serine protease [Verrucomicrobia bacterium]|nr:rhomboid family intramembrane serine protease [Verrucomicrobiota bacterium]